MYDKEDINHIESGGTALPTIVFVAFKIVPLYGDCFHSRIVESLIVL